MKSNLLFIIFCGILTLRASAQDSTSHKQRLDFAKMYLEAGGTYFSSFDGKQLVDGEVQSFESSATINPYLTWGAFHFWGHTEFYVSFPLSQINLSEDSHRNHELTNAVVTGARIYPWAMREDKLRPYLGFNWGSLGLKQVLPPDENQTLLSKDFMLNFDAGILYSHNKTAFRLGVNYFRDNQWKYPLSTTQLTEIETPPISIQVGLIYSFDASKDSAKERADEWNSYPVVSKLSYNAQSFGDFFLGAGPSSSFSLAHSEYNAEHFPYLQQKLTSANYFDLALGYQFNQTNLFAALSYRNPVFQTEGFGTKQTISKNSLAIEVNKFLTDYSGFAPYIGLNVAYDKIDYEQDVDGIVTQHTFTNAIEPGLTFGWDIVPGKTHEALVLRTNLRWYPFSNFEIEGKTVDFSQLEYNLIQVVFYPQRLQRR